MVRRDSTISRGLIIVAGFALLIAACGDGDGGDDALTLDAYFSDAATILQESGDRFAELGSDGLTAEDIQDPADAVALYKEARDIVGNSLDSLRELDAPEEASREHEELVVAANNYVHELDAFIARLQAAQTVDDVQALFASIPGSPLDEAANRLDTSCLQLQDVATARGIDADLGCGD